MSRSDEAYKRGYDAVKFLQQGERLGREGADLTISLCGEDIRLGLDGQRVDEQTVDSYAQMLAILAKKMKHGEQIQGISPTSADLDFLVQQAVGASDAFSPNCDDLTNYRTTLFLKKAIK